LITHVVLMKFTDPANAIETKSRLEALPATIPHIKTLHVGLDVVRSEVSFDLCLTTTHDSIEELRAYQGHPDHLEVGAWLRPLLEARATVDYES
jgi:ABC-type antimicrobial peptide transport system ATPase subunit